MEISLEAVGRARAVLIAGPTASGKSAAALGLARDVARSGRAAWIVNADAMQVYDALRVVTARPSAADEALVPHRLYGHVAAETRYSVGAWLSDAEAVLRDAEAAGVLPIVVGGTGLYFKALTEGLAVLPRIPPEIRVALTERLREEGVERLHAALRERDPRTAANLRPSDPQRVLRALEVLDATGRSLGEWQATAGEPPLLPSDDTVRFALDVDRDTLRGRIERRFDVMVEKGALAEVEALLARRLDPNLPAMKAIGVSAFAGYLRGEASLDAAITAAKAETRRYAKRQRTWLRNQMRDWPRVPS